MTMAEIVCLVLKSTSRRQRRALKGWVSVTHHKAITTQDGIQAFSRRMEKLYARLDNTGNHAEGC